MPTALERTRQALKPGGYVIFGQYAAPPEPLAQRLVALRTIRSGGRVLSAGEATAVLSAAGFDDVRELERTWAAPVRLVIGTRG